MNDLEEAKTHQKIFLKKLKAKKKPYRVSVQGIDITVNPNVFPPVTDSQLMASHIKIKPGNRILDLTTGSGVFAVIAGLQGATGIAVDLHRDAVKNANENFKRFKVDIKAIESDLFDNVPREKFDWIFVNGPYTEGEIKEPLQLAFFGAKSFLTRFFKTAPRYLKKDGKILITIAEWGKLDLFEKLAKQNGFFSRIVDKKISDHKRTYWLYKASCSASK